MANVPIDFAETSVYGKHFNNLYQEVKQITSNAAEYESRLNTINDAWENLIYNLFEYVITDQALKQPKASENNLDRILDFLGKVTSRLPKVEDLSEAISTDDGVLKTFFNILCCHQFKCQDIDRINVNYRICSNPSLSDNYISNFPDYEKQAVEWNILETLSSHLFKNKENDYAAEILNVISYGNEIKKEDHKSYRFAFKYCKRVIQWYIDFSNSTCDISTQIALVLCQP